VTVTPLHPAATEQPDFTSENGYEPHGVPTCVGEGIGGLVLCFPPLGVEKEGARVRLRSTLHTQARREHLRAEAQHRLIVERGNAAETAISSRALARKRSAYKRAVSMTLDMFGIVRTPGGLQITEERYPELLDTWRARTAAQRSAEQPPLALAS